MAVQSNRYPDSGSAAVTQPPVDLPGQGQWRQPLGAGRLAVPVGQRFDEAAQVGTTGDGKADMTRRMPALTADQVAEVRPQNPGQDGQKPFVIHVGDANT
ncbi:hypothetical protein [Streptomyces sp. 1222.5]|uniref:hypothetical protein n=1 Tax=Streptomyces sp. 1222.5 TaxID=1881026 RepID=UPI003D74110F